MCAVWARRDARESTVTASTSRPPPQIGPFFRVLGSRSRRETREGRKAQATGKGEGTGQEDGPRGLSHLAQLRTKAACDCPDQRKELIADRRTTLGPLSRPPFDSSHMRPPAALRPGREVSSEPAPPSPWGEGGKGGKRGASLTRERGGREDETRERMYVRRHGGGGGVLRRPATATIDANLQGCCRRPRGAVPSD